MPKKEDDHLNFHFYKRLFDIVVSVILLTLLFPLFLLIALFIAADSNGKIIFMQNRAGKYEKPFPMYKFRSMYTTAPPNMATQDLADAAAHITPVGRFLRRTSLDELPQLFNVLKGDMSFIGPRPVVLTETRLLALRKRLGADRLRPGITGLAQVRGRDTVSPERKARYDAYYVRHASLRLDCRILMDTFFYVVTGEGIREGGEALTYRHRRPKRHTRH